jgi:hypothetical protein
MAFTSIKTIVPGLAIMHHVKIGCKGEKRQGRSGDYHIPKKLDHFIVTGRERDAKDSNFIIDTEMQGKLGAEVKEIDIRLMYDDLALSFPHRYACYVTANDLKKEFQIESKGKRCYCTGNGENAERLQPDGEFKEIECPGELCEFYQKRYKNPNVRCQLFGRLLFTLSDVDIIGSCADFTTTSRETIRNIIGSLSLITSLTNGILAGIPLKLCMYAASDNVGTTTTTNYKVMVKYEGNEKQLLDEAKQIVMQRSNSMIDIKQLQDQATRVVAQVEHEEEQDIAEEFFPQQVVDPDYQIDGELLSGLDKLMKDLDYNEAKINMELGQYKGREGELKSRLEEEMKQHCESTEQMFSNKEIESSKKKDEVVIPEDNTDKQSIQERWQDLVTDIKKFKLLLDDKAFQEIRNKYPARVDQCSMQELAQLKEELETKHKSNKQ